jgi:putative phosphoribosyl transferase
MIYENREDAAMQLIPYLEKYKHEQVVILAIPRGGVPIGYHIAKAYNFPIELLMTKKIGYPTNPEFAIGAVNLEDYIILEPMDVPVSYITEKVKQIRKNLKERYQLFMGEYKPIDLANKTVIIVDDGIATGNTILSSISMLRRKKINKIVIAVPVAARQSVWKIRKVVDDFICPSIPEYFVGVGMHYKDFSEVSDQEVIALLHELKSLKPVM